MALSLRRHPASECGEAFLLEVEAVRPRANRLSLRYTATGDTSDLLLPALSRSRRRDELWRHTCFEAFIRAEEGGSYFELNLAPSTEWAAYRLSGYREGLTATDVLQPGSLRRDADDGVFRFDAFVDVTIGAELPGDRPWRLGVSAVLEHANGGRSYWALAHGPGKPDFHHPDSFVLDLPPPDPA